MSYKVISKLEDSVEVNDWVKFDGLNTQESPDC